MFEFKKTGQQQKQRFRLRAWVGGLFALACFSVLVGRFWYLQVDRYEGLSERADRNRIAVVPIAPRRGAWSRPAASSPLCAGAWRGRCAC